MPRRTKLTPAKAASAPRAVPFRARYAELEERRRVLHARLAMIRATAQDNPAFKNAMSLLNQRFRAARVAQRESVLDAASWLIDLLSITPL
jgi:hypothetical protein